MRSFTRFARRAVLCAALSVAPAVVGSCDTLGTTWGVDGIDFVFGPELYPIWRFYDPTNIFADVVDYSSDGYDSVGDMVDYTYE